MASVLFPSFCPAVPSPLLGVHNTFFKDKWDFFFFATLALRFTAERKRRTWFREWELGEGTLCAECEVWSASARGACDP